MITDEMIAEAAAKYNDALVQYWQNVEMEEHEFSSKFERKMRRLIWKVKYPYVHKALKSVACILIAFLISFTSVMTFNVEARAAFTRWIREVYKDSIVYEFFGEKSETASLDYRVTWVPEGYELVEEFRTENTYVGYYIKENNDQDAFVVRWALAEDSDKIYIMTDELKNKRISVKINECAGDYYMSLEKNNSSVLLWFNERDSVTFSINAYLPWSDMHRIAESIKK